MTTTAYHAFNRAASNEWHCGLQTDVFFELTRLLRGKKIYVNADVFLYPVLWATRKARFRSAKFTKAFRLRR